MWKILLFIIPLRFGRINDVSLYLLPQYPTLKKLRQWKAHTDDIDDLHMHPQGKHVSGLTHNSNVGTCIKLCLYICTSLERPPIT